MRLPESVTNVEVAVYTTAILGGAGKRVYSEHIAAKCFELDPARFSWRLPEHRGWPDKYIVKTALEDAKKSEYGYLVDGAYNLDPAKDGWSLTHNGAGWFRDNRERIEQHLGTAPQASTTRDQKRLLKEIRGQQLYRQFMRNNGLADVSQYVFTDMLNCSPDASHDVIALKFRRLFASAELAGDEEVIGFLAACAQRFDALMPSWNRREK